MKAKILTDKLRPSTHGVSAYCTATEEYIVIINSELSEEDQEAAFIHEMLHLWRKDLEEAGNLGELEQAAALDTKTYKEVKP